MVTDRTVAAVGDEFIRVPEVGKGRSQVNFAELVKSLYLASAAERVGFIRQGVPASRIVELAEAMHVSREHLSGILRIPRSSVRRKIRQEATLSIEQSERVIGLMSLIGRVAVLMEGSGDPQGFDAARWVGEWLEQPVPALGGDRPADYMGTLSGQVLVFNLLIQSQAGVFA